MADGSTIRKKNFCFQRSILGRYIEINNDIAITAIENLCLATPSSGNPQQTPNVHKIYFRDINSLPAITRAHKNSTKISNWRTAGIILKRFKIYTGYTLLLLLLCPTSGNSY